VDVSIEPFRLLEIDDGETQELEEQGQNMIVPYEGPSLDPRKLRPKVDFGEESNSSGTDASDPEKAKWWETERKVFRGRAEAFIARMHQVQGKNDIFSSHCNYYSHNLQISTYLCLGRKRYLYIYICVCAESLFVSV